MRGRTWPVIGVVFGLAMLLLALSSPRGASATQVLTNAGFEDWSGAAPTDWAVQGGSATKVTVGARSGAAASLQSTGQVSLSQFGEAVAGGTYSASAYFSGVGSGEVTVLFFDSSLASFPIPIGISLALGPGFTRVAAAGAWIAAAAAVLFRFRPTSSNQSGP